MNLQEQLQNDPTFQQIQSLIAGRAASPFTLTPELVSGLKATRAQQAQDIFGQTTDELAARFGQTSGVRSGPFAAALGSASEDLASNIAQSNQALDVAAAEKVNEDLMNIFNLVSGLTNLGSQFEVQRANLLAGAAPAFASAGPSPLQAAGQGLGGILAAATGGLLSPGQNTTNIFGGLAGLGGFGPYYNVAQGNMPIPFNLLPL